MNNTIDTINNTDTINNCDNLLNLNLSDIKFKKSKEVVKDKDHLIYYIMTDKNKKRLSVYLTDIQIPFGPEKYNDKIILNIEINPKKNNIHYNYKAIISGFESEFSNKENFTYGKLLKDIEGKGYYPNIRESKEGFIIRTYIITEPEVFSMTVGKNKSIKFKNKLSIKDTVKVVANVKLELGPLWINDNNYGLLWYVKQIEVLYSV